MAPTWGNSGARPRPARSASEPGVASLHGRPAERKIIGTAHGRQFPCSAKSYSFVGRIRPVHSNRSATSNDVGDDHLWLLRSLQAESVDLIYLDLPFFSSWISEGSWVYQAELNSSEDRRGGVGNYMGWVAASLEEMHRVLKPTGALLLICDKSVGLYVRVLLDELIGPRDLHRRMTLTKVTLGSEHHYIFYYHKSAEIGRHGHHYTVIRRQTERDCSLVAFSFVQGRRARRATHLCDGNTRSTDGAIPVSIPQT
jgi:hypothetical protein